MIRETWNLEFERYLRESTGYDVNIFKAFDARIDKIITKGKITTDNQFYDVQILVNDLCQAAFRV